MPDNKSKVSPIVAIAATSLTLFSLVGIGVLTGVIPSSYSQNAGTYAIDAPAKNADGRSARRASETQRASTAEAPKRVAACAACGTVASVKLVEKKGEGSGLGAVAGGVVGGVLGNQVGGGHGRQIATVAGVAGGALAGHEIEKRYKSERHYAVAVRMEDGSMGHYTYDTEPPYAAGDRVKVIDGRLTR